MKGYSVAMGGYTDFSQGPDDERPASWDRNIDYYGGTFSVGMDKDLTESRFGVRHGLRRRLHDAISNGSRTAAASRSCRPSSMKRQDGIARVRQNFEAYNFGIFLSSTLKI